MRHFTVVGVCELQPVVPLALPVEKPRHALQHIVVHLPKDPRRVADRVERAPPLQQFVHPIANDAAASKTNVTRFIFISLSSLVDFDFVYRRDNAGYRKQWGKTDLRKQALE